MFVGGNGALAASLCGSVLSIPSKSKRTIQHSPNCFRSFSVPKIEIENVLPMGWSPRRTHRTPDEARDHPGIRLLDFARLNSKRITTVPVSVKLALPHRSVLRGWPKQNIQEAMFSHGTSNGKIVSAKARPVLCQVEKTMTSTTERCSMSPAIATLKHLHNQLEASPVFCDAGMVRIMWLTRGAAHMCNENM